MYFKKTRSKIIYKNQLYKEKIQPQTKYKEIFLEIANNNALKNIKNTW